MISNRQTKFFLMGVCIIFALHGQVMAEVIYNDAVGYWAFEGTGSTIQDTSLTSAVDLTMNSGDPVRVEGVVGNALQIDNSRSFFATSNGDYDSLDLSRDEDFTAASWVNPSGKTAIMSKMYGSGGNYRGWWLLVELDGNVEFLVRSTNSPAEYLWMTTEVSIPDNEWSHVAVTFDYDATDPARGVQFYIDGQAVTTVPKNSSSQGLEEEPAPPTDNDVSFNINSRQDGNYTTWGGMYDEMAVWKRVLTPGEIAQIGTQVPEPGTFILLLGLLGTFGLFRFRRY